MFGKKLKKYKQCDVCTGPVKHRESIKSTNFKKLFYECMICKHIQIEFKNIINENNRTNRILL